METFAAGSLISNAGDERGRAAPSVVRISGEYTEIPEASNNTTPAIRMTRARRNPNGEQTLI